MQKTKIDPAKRDESIRFARHVLETPPDLVRYLDCETTDVPLHSREIIQLGIIDGEGDGLFCGYFKPKLIISEGASAIHGITWEQARHYPQWDQRARDVVASLLEPAEMVIIFNAPFDVGALNTTCQLHMVQYLPEFNAVDLMVPYHRWLGRRQALGGGHSALSDCKASLELVRKMAESRLSTEPKIDDPELVQ